MKAWREEEAIRRAQCEAEAAAAVASIPEQATDEAAA